MVDFSLFDLTGAGPVSPPASIYGDFDLITCCNILFYYNKEAQNTIISKLKRSLKTGGFLITDEAERSIIKSAGGFSSFTPFSSVFIKS